MEKDKVAYKVWVSGRVQGVFFRKYTCDKALELDLCGHVENLTDGRVYAEVEGEKGAVDAFLEWLWQGSPSSEVKAVEKEILESQGAGMFFIKR